MKLRIFPRKRKLYKKQKFSHSAPPPPCIHMSCHHYECFILGIKYKDAVVQRMAQNLPQNSIIISVTISIDIPITLELSFSLLVVNTGCFVAAATETLLLISCLYSPVLVKLFNNSFLHEEYSNFLHFSTMMSLCFAQNKID